MPGPSTSSTAPKASDRGCAGRPGWLHHAPFIAAAVVCVGVFAWMLTYGTGQLLADDVFANFYDHQAQAWLHGRWDVPEPVLSGEAFVVNGRVYGYFGPTPALMRLPLVATGVEFGRLTRVFMLLDYAACLFGAYAILRHVWRVGAGGMPKEPGGSDPGYSGASGKSGVGANMSAASAAKRRPVAGLAEPGSCEKPGVTDPSYSGASEPSKPSGVGDPGYRSAGRTVPAWLTVVITAGTGLGSTLFFLGSRPYVYHEAILCGAAFALWAVWCALRYVEESGSRWWIGSVICGVLAVHARPPIGLFALTFLGAVALWHAVQQRRWAPVWVALAAAVGVASFNAVSYLKFGTFEGCPLRLNVQYTPEKLAALGNENFNLGNLHFNADSYLLVPSASVRPQFPYIFLEYLDRKQYPASRMAYRDPTLALPYSTSGLVFLALAGTAAAFGTRHRLRTTLGLLWISAVPFALAMLTAVAITNRYTADFDPFLIATAATAAVAVSSCAIADRRTVATTTVILTAVAAIVQFATTLHNQRAVVWGVPPSVQEQYQSWQHHIDTFFHGQPGH